MLVTATFYKVFVYWKASLCHNFVACEEIEQEHTSENLKTLLGTITREWHIRMSLPGYVVINNMRKFMVAIPHMYWTNITCFANTFQLFMHDGKVVTEEFQSLNSKARPIIGHYECSSQSTTS